jgi:hypothetical protein
LRDCSAMNSASSFTQPSRAEPRAAGRELPGDLLRV